MKPLLRHGTILTACALAFAGLWHVLQDDEGPSKASPDGEPSLIVDDLQRFVVRKNGVPLWEIAARRVVMAADGQSTIATGVDKGVLFRDGAPFLRLSAQRVRFANSSNNLSADGFVRASGPNGFAVQTPRAIWHHAAKKLECPNPVKAQIKNLHFQTPKLSYESEKGLLKCPQPVEVTTAGASLKGAKMEVQVKERIIKIKGGAELVFDPRVVKPSEIGVKGEW